MINQVSGTREIQINHQDMRNTVRSPDMNAKDITHFLTWHIRTSENDPVNSNFASNLSVHPLVDMSAFEVVKKISKREYLPTYKTLLAMPTTVRQSIINEMWLNSVVPLLDATYWMQAIHRKYLMLFLSDEWSEVNDKNWKCAIGSLGSKEYPSFGEMINPHESLYSILEFYDLKGYRYPELGETETKRSEVSED